MIKRKSLLLVFGLSFLLTGCQTNNPPKDDTDNPNEPDNPEEPGDNTPEEPEDPTPEEPTFEVEDIMEFEGTYYDKNQTLTVADNKVILGNDNESLTITNIVEEKMTSSTGLFTRTVAYLKDGDGKEYKMYYTPSTFYTLQLEEKTEDGYELVNDFQPANEELKGAFNYYGDGSTSNLNLYFGNEFDNTYGVFKINYGNYNISKTTDTYYYVTYYGTVDGEKTFFFNIYDYSDNYDYGRYTLTTIDGVVGLYSSAYDYLEYVSDTVNLSDSYYFEDGSEITLTADTNTKTVVYNDVTYTYSSSFDANGQLITLKSDGHNDVLIRPGVYGATFTEGEVTKYGAFNETNYFENYIFGNKDIKFTFGLDLDGNYSLLVNEQKTEYEFVISEKRKSIKFTLNGSTYIVSPEKFTVALKITKGDEVEYLVNESFYKTLFISVFINVVDGKMTTLTCDSELNVSYGTNESSKGYLFYVPGMETPTLKFDVDGVTNEFVILDENNKICLLYSGDSVSTYFEKAKFDSGYGTYTHKFEKDIVFDETTITYYGDEVNYSLVAEYNASSFSYDTKIEFLVDDVKHTLTYSSTMVLSEDIYENGSVVDSITYIKYEYFESLCGTYYFDGAYGPEKFRLTKDGHFYADTLNKETNKLEEVEYNYRLTMNLNTSTGKLEPVIGFEAQKNVFVLLYQVENGLISFSSIYVREDIFNLRGVYATSDESTVVYMVDNLVYLNGKEYNIKDINVLTDGISFVADGLESTFTFTNEGQLTVDDGVESLQLNKVNFNPIDYVGEYHSESEPTVSIKFEAVKDVMTNVVSYKLCRGDLKLDYVVTSYEGHLALKFTNLFSTYYLYKDGDSIVYVEEGGLLPPPPPPPPAF